MNSSPTTRTEPLDLEAIRLKLDREAGQRYWRSLDEVAQTPEFRELLHREFPQGASEWADGLDRRSFFKLAAASLALAGLTACTKQPNAKILPYVKQPEEMVPGEALYYATTMLLGGYGAGVVVKSREGHPIKVEGNPQHPATPGGSTIWMQASILDLYDPDRSQNVIHNGEISTWGAFLSEVNQLAREHAQDQGAGMRFLAETMTSPTMAAQFDALLKKFPKAKVYQFESISRDNIRQGSRLAFDEVVETHYRFDQAATIVSLESDFLYLHPQRLRYTRDFTNGRRVSAGTGNMNRLYVAESTPTVTGTMADHRLATGSQQIEKIARDIGGRLGVIRKEPIAWPPEVERWIAAVVEDLQKNQGKSIIVAGEWQPPSTHALTHLLNQRLGNAGNTVFYTEPADFHPGGELNSLRDLVADIKNAAVKTLFILGGNPAYTAPADFEFAALLPKVRRSIYLGTHLDETAALCAWHIPEAHYLEGWGDAKSFDGAISLQQPLIQPLYGGKTACEVLDSLFLRQPVRGGYEIVRDHWLGQNIWPDFEKGWRRALHDGVIADTRSAEKKPTVANASLEQMVRDLSPGSNAPPAIEITFRPDPSIWDGRFANNGWLQESPKPASKLTWDNAIIVSPRLAQRRQLANGNIVEIDAAGRTLRGPIWIQPGQAENTITLHLGYGRSRAGRVGSGIGFNAGQLRSSASFWQTSARTLVKISGHHEFAATQTHHNLQSPERQVYRETTLENFHADPQVIKKSIEEPANNETLYDTREFPYAGYKWAMSIDLNTCIGCNACLLACNAENNIPVVGKEQVRRSREMHWIRIDTYYTGPLENPEFRHMPVPCMHCEHAPCELVCPVEATVHDHEGLNLQIYNRCVGTRFCSNNCPYKVRRFNFLWYADYETGSLKPLYNPEVTVRWRGVMEKCTYCIQRINRARIGAEKENRRIRDGEIQTACQQACPAEAIVFGDLNSPQSNVAKLKAHSLDYSMLGELNTRPRTTYLAKLRNPAPQFEGRSIA